MMKVILIAAVAENGVIGNDGEIPWDYSEDLEHFKETTTGSPVIMGRKTFESIIDRLGSPLPNRMNIVLTSDSGAVYDSEWTSSDGDWGFTPPVGSIDEAVWLAESVADDIEASETYVIGGASVYEQFIDRADKMIITEIPGEYEGDTYFPEWDDSEWKAMQGETREELTITTYGRVEDRYE